MKKLKEVKIENRTKIIYLRYVPYHWAVTVRNN